MKILSKVGNHENVVKLYDTTKTVSDKCIFDFIK